MKLHSAALTHVGRIRRQNEDCFLQDDALGAYGVADGIGGLPGGDIAAQATMEALRTALGGAMPRNAGDLAKLVRKINGEVSTLGETISPGAGIGTTLTFGVFTDTRLLLAHVGDSRCYRLSGERFEPLTEDHSVENEARHRRERGEDIRYPSHYSQALTRCIGQPTNPAVDTTVHVLVPDDLILFVTDGVTRILSEKEIARILGAETSLDDRLANLIEQTNERGGPDNATAVLVAVEG